MNVVSFCKRCHNVYTNRKLKYCKDCKSEVIEVGYSIIRERGFKEYGYKYEISFIEKGLKQDIRKKQEHS